LEVVNSCLTVVDSCQLLAGDIRLHLSTYHMLATIESCW